MSDDLLKVSEVAARLRMNPATIRAWLKSGRLQGIHLGSDRAGWRISESALQRFLVAAVVIQADKDEG